jgi:2-dehydro-3-deoxyglucarate aldolase/4-hydroxy-2-oxoheptanedioate aldolase
MRENHVKRRLARGEVCLGTLVLEFSSSGLPRIAQQAGVDFVLFDQEHSGWTTDTIRQLLAASRAAEFVPLVRVPAAQYHLISQVLDLGAMGVMVPMVETVEQAELIVRSAKYPPMGRRGAAFGVAHDDYVSGKVLEKIASANQETLLIAQIETVAGLEQVERIAAIPGIDIVWLGHFDLTNSMGIPAQFTDARYLAAVKRIATAAQQKGKAAGFMAASAEEAASMLEKGYRCLAYWGDIWIYGQALKAGLESVRKVAASIVVRS